MERTDTATEAERFQIDVHRSMTGAERVRLAFEMSEQAREITRAGIRDRHPQLDEAGVRDEFLRRVLSRELAAEVIASRRPA